MNGKGWRATLAGAGVVLALILSFRGGSQSSAPPNSISDQPAARMAQRQTIAVQRQPTILRADAAIMPGHGTQLSPIREIPLSPSPERWPEAVEDPSPAGAYDPGDSDFLAIPPRELTRP